MFKEGKIYKSKQYKFMSEESIKKVRRDFGIRDRRSYDDILKDRMKQDYSYKYTSTNFLTW